MIRMKNIVTLVFVVMTIFFLPACNSSDTKLKNTQTGTTAVEQSEGWENLSDRKKPAWHTYGKNYLGSAWKVEDNSLHLDATVKDGWQTRNGGDIVSNEEYENFDLKLEWEIAGGGNSGIMFYVKEDTTKYKYPWETGPETQVADNEKNEDGKIDKARAGDMYDLMAISKNVIKPAGEWNQVEIVANKGRLDFHINNEQVLSTTLWDDAWRKNIAATKFSTMPDFGTFKKGRIALQDHGADVWYRNIKIKKL